MPLLIKKTRRAVDAELLPVNSDPRRAAALIAHNTGETEAQDDQEPILCEKCNKYEAEGQDPKSKSFLCDQCAQQQGIRLHSFGSGKATDGAPLSAVALRASRQQLGENIAQWRAEFVKAQAEHDEGGMRVCKHHLFEYQKQLQEVESMIAKAMKDVMPVGDIGLHTMTICTACGKKCEADEDGFLAPHKGVSGGVCPQARAKDVMAGTVPRCSSFRGHGTRCASCSRPRSAHFVARAKDANPPAPKQKGQCQQCEEYKPVYSSGPWEGICTGCAAEAKRMGLKAYDSAKAKDGAVKDLSREELSKEIAELKFKSRLSNVETARLKMLEAETKARKDYNDPWAERNPKHIHDGEFPKIKAGTRPSRCEFGDCRKTAVRYNPGSGMKMCEFHSHAFDPAQAKDSEEIKDMTTAEDAEETPAERRKREREEDEQADREERAEVSRRALATAKANNGKATDGFEHVTDPSDHLATAQQREIAGDKARAMDSYRAAAAGFRLKDDRNGLTAALDGIAACNVFSRSSSRYDHPGRGKVRVCDSADTALRTALERTRAGERVSICDGLTVKPTAYESRTPEGKVVVSSARTKDESKELEAAKVRLGRARADRDKEAIKASQREVVRIMQLEESARHAKDGFPEPHKPHKFTPTSGNLGWPAQPDRCEACGKSKEDGPHEVPAKDSLSDNKLYQWYTAELAKLQPLKRTDPARYNEEVEDLRDEYEHREALDVQPVGDNKLYQWYTAELAKLQPLKRTDPARYNEEVEDLRDEYEHREALDVQPVGDDLQTCKNGKPHKWLKERGVVSCTVCGQKRYPDAEVE